MRSGIAPVLLATKIRPPRIPNGAIERPRLLSLAESVPTKTLTIVKAAAGYGKSCFATALADRLREGGGSVAWVTIDAMDDEPLQFLFNVASVLGRGEDHARSEAADFIREMSLASARTILVMLINEIADRDDEVFLFLDDYHLISQDTIHDGIMFLLNNAPSNLHLVILTRADPPLRVSRLRARDQVLEIDASDLRFDAEETRRFLEQANPSGMVPDELRALTARLEGWPAMLRVAVSTHGHRSMGRTGSHTTASRQIENYLDEMLAGLPAALSDFMIRTAILEQITAPLCDAVLGIANSRDVLRDIETRALLLIPLDREGTWFRFHPLLRDFLVELSNSLPAAERTLLHCRAAQWCAERELWTDAVTHALAAGDEQRAAAWVERCAAGLLKRGELLPLMRWRQVLPARLMRGQIKVRLAIAWSLALVMRFDDGMNEVASIEADPVTGAAMDPKDIRYECQAIRAVAFTLRDDSAAARSIAEAALEQPPRGASTFNALSDVALFCYWKAGDFTRFHATPWMPFSSEQRRRNVFVEVYRCCLLGLVLHEQLRLAAAERHYRDAIQLAELYVGPDPAAAAMPASALAALRYDQGRLDEAETLLIDRLRIVDEIGMLECVAQAYFTLVAIAGRRAQPDRAFALLNRAEAVGRERRWVRLMSGVNLWRVRLFAAASQFGDAAECLAVLDRLAERHPAPAPCAWSAIHDHAAEARAVFTLADGRARDAIPLVARLCAAARSADRRGEELRLSILMASALEAAGAREEAVDAVTDAVVLAAPVSLLQPFLDARPDVLPVIRRVDPGRLPGCEAFLKQCLAGLSAAPQEQASGSDTPALSPRERSVLALLSEGRSNKDIARALSIAPETVKSHVKNIFGKIGVERRAQAVSRAMSLGLIRTV
jgi:LuxR family transcriptional regulator, maltose regulon positive regulatory protein